MRTCYRTVSFHNFKSQNFKLSVSNPKSKYVAYLSVLSQISNCQGLGRKNKHDILKTDRTVLVFVVKCRRAWSCKLHVARRASRAACCALYAACHAFIYIYIYMYHVKCAPCIHYTFINVSLSLSIYISLSLYIYIYIYYLSNYYFYTWISKSTPCALHAMRVRKARQRVDSNILT